MKLRTIFKLHRFACLVLATAATLATGGCATQQQMCPLPPKGDETRSAAVVPSPREAYSYPDLEQLRAMTERFVVTPMVADLSVLPASERLTLAKLIEAVRIVDGIYLRQVWSGNEALLLQLARERSALGQARLRYFLINMGPWSWVDNDMSFVPGPPRQKPRGGNFYPEDATKEEIERWMKTLPPEKEAEARGFFSVIRRGPGGLFALPYSVEFQGELSMVASLLREAAATTTNKSLRTFLLKRADALLSNDYFASDIAWMELDSPLEAVLGPYEVYDDELFGYKAAFSAFLMLRDDGGTQKISMMAGFLQELENNLPIDPKLRNPKLGRLAPMLVANVVFAGGDPSRRLPAAFILPNDERVVKEKGAKRIIVKNMVDAIFSKLLKPVADLSLVKGQEVSFDALFINILMHEMMHGLGPQEVRVKGERTAVRIELKETYSAIEEAKADIGAMWALQYLIDRGALDKELEQTMYETHLVSCLLGVRSSLNEPHAVGRALQLNSFLDAGAVRLSPEGKFSVDHPKMKEAVRDLTAELLNVQAEADYRKAKKLIADRGVVRPDVQRVVARMEHLPLGVIPEYPEAEKLLRPQNEGG